MANTVTIRYDGTRKKYIVRVNGEEVDSGTNVARLKEIYGSRNFVRFGKC